MTSTAKKNWKRMFSGPTSGLLETDPEFAQFFADFAFDEVPLQDDLDDRSRMMAILAALIGSQSTETFEAMLPAALGLGVTPVEAREIVYQAAAYLGIGRTLPFLQGVYCSRHLPATASAVHNFPGYPFGTGRAGPGGYLWRTDA